MTFSMYDIQQVYTCIPKNKLKMTPSSFDSVTYKLKMLFYVIYQFVFLTCKGKDQGDKNNNQNNIVKL